MTEKKVSLWNLFWTFFKTGAFTFGGGYAMISILEEDLVEKKHWITAQDMLDMIVIAESTPGVIAVNTATSIGYRKRGVIGALLATLGVILPSFLLISVLTFFITQFSENYWYKAAFTGIQACVTVLIVNAFVKMFSQLTKDVFSYIMLVGAFVVAVFTDFDVIYLILIGGVLGVALTYIKLAVSKNKKLPLKNEEDSPLDENFEGQKTALSATDLDNNSQAPVCDEKAIDNNNFNEDNQSYTKIDSDNQNFDASSETENDIEKSSFKKEEK